MLVHHLRSILQDHAQRAMVHLDIRVRERNLCSGTPEQCRTMDVSSRDLRVAPFIKTHPRTVFLTI